MKIINILLFYCFLTSCSASFEESYYPNGQLEYRVPIINGVRNGKLEKYYSDGQMQYVSNWNNGVKEGEAIAYFRNGVIQIKENYKDGLPHGLVEEYYNAGDLKRKMTYDNGKILEEISYFENNSIEGKIKIDLDTIRATYYHRNGLIDEISVRIGEDLLYAKKFDLNGKLVSSNLPISATGRVSKNDTSVKVEIEYKLCNSCKYLIILGEFDEDNVLVNEYFRDTFLSNPMSFKLYEEQSIRLPIKGSLYELDTTDTVVGYSPFEIADSDANIKN